MKIKILSILIICIMSFSVTFANYTNEINIDSNSDLLDELHLNEGKMSRENKKTIDNFIEKLGKSDSEKLIKIYKKIKVAKDKIATNNSIKYKNIKVIINYLRAKIGLLIHDRNDIKKIISEQSAILELGKYYLIPGEFTNTIFHLDGFGASYYMDGKIAPIMKIYSEYEAGKYFQTLSTFVLPEGKSPNTGEDGFRNNINNIAFAYKLIDFNVGNNITLEVKSKGLNVVNIQEINIGDNKYTLQTREDLTDISSGAIYELLRVKVLKEILK